MAINRLAFIFFIAAIAGALSEEKCSTYNFESNFEHFQNEGTFCEPFPSWTVGYYSSMDIEKWDEKSVSFVYPGSSLSCIASFPFPMSGGVLEVNVFINSTSFDDNLSAVLLMKSPKGTDPVLGSQMIHQSTGAVSGWHTIRINVHSTIGEFDGYIAFLGAAVEGSTILVDSFKFTPSGVSGDCDIYGDGSNAITPNIPTEAPELEDKCITLNFEDDFDIEFTVDNYLCEGFLPWHLENYQTHHIQSPNTNSEYFISPRSTTSCIASKQFAMSPNGRIEANVYMDAVDALDHIIILAQRKRTDKVDAVVGFHMYYPSNENFVAGWNVLNFSVSDFNSFEGYLLMFGIAHEGATVLIDSMRYIPPTASPNDVECVIYQ